MKHRPFLVATALAACAISASAQTMKPGLWEVTSKMGGNPELQQAMAGLEKQMAAMPPAQRKQMQDMLDKQGVSLSTAAGGGMVTRACIIKEMIDRGQLATQQQGNCTTTNDKTANGYKMKYTCTNPASTGEGVFTFTGGSAYKMNMTMNAAHQGKPQTTTMEATGKWLGGDCGTLKPMVLPK